MADSADAGDMRGSWQWPTRAHLCGCNYNVFFEEENDCNWDCGYRKQSRFFVSTGSPWAVRVLALMMLGSLIVCCTIMRLRPRPRQLTTLIDFCHFHDRSYMAFVAAFALMISPVYVPFFFIQKYALKLEIDDDMAF
ncbi:MFS general substrate transporter [Penicillium malachiteum]|uniref:MFS general substrate transporter n=1 Tax=Penicillium malachiteum TaxID=1324776 RepID=UPI002547D707|nr:MFS general substrate transporter [Penicillium malachiteum]KAJ5715341.1 MFS general substrate transporter [Penicillium malachiteum]